MKVLMFGWEFPPHIAGGLGTACYGITKGLAKNNVDVTFVMPNAFGDEDQSNIRILNASDIEIDPRFSEFYNQTQNISFIEVNSKLVPYVGLDDYFNVINQLKSGHFEETKSAGKRRYKFAGGYGGSLMEEVAHFAVIAAELAKNETFDVIHAHDWHTYRAGIAAKKVSGKPLAVHIHATEFDRSGEHNLNTVVYEIEREGMAAADAVFAVSDLTRNIVINKYGIDPAKVHTVHNALEPNTKETKRKKAVQEKIVTFLGRVTFQKGPEYFVEMARKILEYHPNVRFVLAGDGDLMTNTIERVAELGISDRFHFTGFLRGDDINKMFGMSDVYVMPSISEPFGISPLEAMQAHVPVVISKQSGVSEVLQYAIKVDFWDIDAMADAIHGILNYPALAKFFAEKGAEDVHNLKWEKVGKQILAHYNQLVT
ncbi:glycosyltransferase family 4 protein [Bacteroidales bacterium OttesenSCG-928-B11]|nr:glycosyltransferase family 4 protein [Bacteroidales bacterium OttesenSCG-928-E04]MDL2311977.1 glycosyltransferase family 4 protein [Bacteroidales bacterium OttesenSCG-928-B11]MDL2326833.1 glycosyltransferase family 4 protein [Bacteroidales bacterium OttesenSCG-928-A14]